MRFRICVLVGSLMYISLLSRASRISNTLIGVIVGGRLLYTSLPLIVSGSSNALICVVCLSITGRLLYTSSRAVVSGLSKMLIGPISTITGHDKAGHLHAY